MLCTEMSVVEALTRKVEVMISWDLIDSLVNLMKKLVEAKGESDSREDRQKIYELGERVERRVIELVQKESDDASRDWQNDCLGSTELLWFRDFLRGQAKEAPTANMRKSFSSGATKVQEMLNSGSERMAESLLLDAENALSLAQDFCDGGQNLRSAEIDLQAARDAMERIKQKPHVWHVGLPRVAKKRDVSADVLCNCIMRRIETSEIILRTLVSQAEEERRQKIMREYEHTRKLTAEEERLRRKEQIERTIQTIEHRNKPAGKATRQFLEHVKLGNAGGAWACLEQIRLNDGGVPLVLQQEYQRLAREKIKIREI